MTYYELLEKTQKKKEKAIRELDSALKGTAGYLVEAEIKRNPGSVAWLWLAKEFCETIADHVWEWLEYYGADSPDAIEIGDIYMKYENSDPDLYSSLPVEARLFD